MTKEGWLEKNEIGRLEVGGHELTSGSIVEVLLSGQWVRGRIEYIHDWAAYGLVLHGGPVDPILPLFTGMTARLPSGAAPFRRG